MKTNRFLSNLAGKLCIAALAMSAMVVSSCDDDDNNFEGSPYFSIDGFTEAGNDFIYEMDYKKVDTTSLTAAKVFTVRSNRPWQIVASEAENGWCRVWPGVGEGDGLIRVSALENGSAIGREMIYNIIVEGMDTGRRFIVKQKGSDPYIRSSVVEVNIPRTGGSTTLLILANVPYEKPVITDADGKTVDWVTYAETATNTFEVRVPGVNDTGDSRLAFFHMQGSGEYSNIAITVPIYQTYAIITDDFSWVPALDGSSVLGWDTTNENRYDLWIKNGMSQEDFDAHKWVCRSTWLYARPGFIKLGKTNYGGDVISPKMEELGEGTFDVQVQIQAVGYSSAGGTMDDRELLVGVLGDGEITEAHSMGAAEVDDVTNIAYANDKGGDMIIPKMKRFTLTEAGTFLKARDETGMDVWSCPDTKCVVTIKGATKNTQVVYIGGTYGAALKNVGKGKNRIFLDNYQVIQL
ncbi:MAG: hypothetical protein ACI4UN_04750 [Muribaculaceae bacterium]